MAFDGYGGHDFGFQLVRKCLCWVAMFVFTIPTERVGAVDIVQAMRGRIAFVIAEVDPQTELLPLRTCATR